jgi:hypothetical protein
MRRDLVQRAMAHDHEAFSELARLSIDRLYALARLILRDSQRAEDATQEALVLAWRDLAALRDPDRFEVWLRRLWVMNPDGSGLDFEDAVRTAVGYLDELGHRNIALLDRAPYLAGLDHGPTIRARAGFEAEIRQRSLDGEHLLCGSGGNHYIQVLRFLERTPACTAVITISVTFTPLLAALRDLGKRVPDDISIVAIVAPQVADLVTPPLTTIDLPAFEMGRLGAEILLRQLADGPGPPTQVVLRGALQVRSSAPPPATLQG